MWGAQVITKWDPFIRIRNSESRGDHYMPHKLNLLTYTLLTHTAVRENFFYHTSPCFCFFFGCYEQSQATVFGIHLLRNFGIRNISQLWDYLSFCRSWYKNEKLFNIYFGSLNQVFFFTNQGSKWGSYLFLLVTNKIFIISYIMLKQRHYRRH